LAISLLAAGCSESTTSGSTSTTKATVAAVAHWLAPADPMGRAVAAGLLPDTKETLQHHVHAHLDVFVDGVPQIVPAGVGIRIDDPAVKTGPGPSYGGISVPCETPCISPLHTHAPDGVLHTESPVNVDNTLGQFFVEWGVVLDGRCVGEYCSPDKAIAVYVDGKPVPTDAASVNGIALLDRREIAIVIGTPPATIPDAFPTA
jgi:hypothetical protein